MWGRGLGILSFGMGCPVRYVWQRKLSEWVGVWL